MTIRRKVIPRDKSVHPLVLAAISDGLKPPESGEMPGLDGDL